VDVHIFDQQQDLKISHAKVQDIVRQVLSLEGKNCDEVSIHLVDTPTISTLHERYFGDASITDCISFPIDIPNKKGYCVLGEVFVCPKVAIDYAKEHKCEPYHEMTLYIVHGLLHLLGYDDQGEVEAEMRAAEARHMKNLGAKDLLLDAYTQT